MLNNLMKFFRGYFDGIFVIYTINPFVFASVVTVALSFFLDTPEEEILMLLT